MAIEPIKRNKDYIKYGNIFIAEMASSIFCTRLKIMLSGAADLNNIWGGKSLKLYLQISILLQNSLVWTNCKLISMDSRRTWNLEILWRLCIGIVFLQKRISVAQGSTVGYLMLSEVGCLQLDKLMAKLREHHKGPSNCKVEKKHDVILKRKSSGFQYWSNFIWRGKWEDISITSLNQADNLAEDIKIQVLEMIIIFFLLYIIKCVRNEIMLSYQYAIWY